MRKFQTRITALLSQGSSSVLISRARINSAPTSTPLQTRCTDFQSRVIQHNHPRPNHKIDKEVNEILGKEGTTNTNINTFGLITAEMVEQILKDKCVTAQGMLKSVLKMMRVEKIT